MMDGLGNAGPPHVRRFYAAYYWGLGFVYLFVFIPIFFATIGLLYAVAWLTGMEAP